MRGIVVGAALLVACAKPSAFHCDGVDGGPGWECLSSDQACARPPVFCGPPEPVAACKTTPDFQPCTLPGSTGAAACYGGVCTACSADLEGCTFSDWLAMTPATTTVDLNAIWVAQDPPGEFDAYAVGTNGSVLHYDGAAWSTVPSTPTIATALRAVWGSDARNVFAVGDGGVVLQLANGAWTMTVASSADLYGVWGSSASDVFAVDRGIPLVQPAAVHHFDGASWTAFAPQPVLPSNTSLRAICGTRSGSIDKLIVVGSGGYAAVFDGSTWTSSTPVAPPLNSVWCNNASDAFAVGDNSAIAHYAGTWSAQLASPVSPLLGVWGASSNDVYAISGVTTGKVFHYDGATWSQLNVTLPLNTGIAGSLTMDVFVVGKAGAITRHIDGM